MNRVIITLTIVLLTVLSVNAQAYNNTCRFSTLFTQDQLFNNASARKSFIDTVLFWEGNFHQDGAGFNGKVGYTYDGCTLDYLSGELSTPLHNFSAPSKESIHLGMAALGLMGANENGNNALDFFHVHITQSGEEAKLLNHRDEKGVGSAGGSANDKNMDNLLTILYRKIVAYEAFNDNYPGYGGFFPWVTVSDQGIWPIEGYWSERVPGLDNGEMIWGMMGLISALNQTAATASNPTPFKFLAGRYQNYLNLLKSNAKMVFYTQPGYINAVTLIGDTTAAPTPDNYKNDCDCYLDDPYEGELLLVFMDLYCQWDSMAERDQLWINKRPQLQVATLQTPQGNITVQRGFWFSSHEQWKYLMLPYQDVPINARVFQNGERARSWFSYMNQYPGMFASVNNVTKYPSVSPNYVSAAGIQEIAIEVILSNAVSTPYGSFPLFLIPDIGSQYALPWYHNMISAPSMQNPYGSTESVDNIGTEICPLLTWDAKITTVLAMMGGVVDLNRQTMINDNVIDRFLYVVDREWSMVFTSLEGEDLPFQLPVSTIPHVLGDFTSCSL